MCGRFTLRSIDRIRLALGDRINLEYVPPRYNIAPTQPVVTVIGDHVEDLVWGLIPNWSKEPKGIINARAETLDDKASQAYCFQKKEEAAFAFAGIWDRWRNGELSIKSCALLTTTANDVLRPVHDRMPVILGEESYETWLDSQVSPVELKKLLEPYPSEEMKSHPVSSQVNYADIDNEVLIKRVDVEVGTTPSLF